MNISRRGFLGGALSMGALGGCQMFCDPTGSYASGTPALTFGILSDIHFHMKPWEKKEHVASGSAMFIHALEYFRDQGVDGVVICGDLADSGLVYQLQCVADAWWKVFPNDKAPDGRKVERLFVTGNHDWEGQNYGTTIKKHFPDPKEFAAVTLRENLAQKWEKIFHEPFKPVWKKEVKGYTFVGAHWCRGGCRGKMEDFNSQIPVFYSAEKDFDPALPFFHLQHPHPLNTCYGSWAWGHDRGSTSLLMLEHPNAIAFSGHSHYSLTDERSVWQGHFTSIGAGSLFYTGTPYDELSPAGYENTPAAEKRKKYDGEKMTDTIPFMGEGNQGMLAKVFTDRIVFIRREFRFNESLGADWVLPWPTPPKAKPFDFKIRAAAQKAPAFPADAKLTCACKEKKNRSGVIKNAVIVSIPAANALAGVRAYSYDVTAETKEGKALKTKRVLDRTFNMPLSKTDKVTMCVFARAEIEGATHVRVTPLSCFGNAGKALITSIA